MGNIVIKQTSLSTANSIQDCLEWKLVEMEAKGTNLQSGLADYIYRGTGEVESQLEQLKTLKAEIRDRETYLKEQLQSIKEGSAKFLGGMGVEKISGNIVSSVTVIKGKQASTKEKFVRDCNTKDMEACLLNAGLGHLESVDVAAAKDTVRINKRRVGTATIEA